MDWKIKLNKIIKKNKSHLVIGLDPDIRKIPNFLFKYKNPVSLFNKLIIESTKNIVAGYKFNLAFYENFKTNGYKSLFDSIKFIPENLFMICDGKRGDITNTTELYARSYFDFMNFDAITASPYMGLDSLEPFLKRKNKLTFILALTSNPGYSDFQKLKVSSKPLYKVVISKFLKNNRNSNIGFVFGANQTKEIIDFSKYNPKVPILIPGIGAQNNDLKKLLNSIKSNIYLINSSRNIIYSSKVNCTENDFIESVSKSSKNLSSQIEIKVK